MPEIAETPCEPIRSRRNPLVRRIRQLHEARGRRDQAMLLLEGTHLLQEVQRLGLQAAEVVASEAWLQRHAPLLAQLPGPWQLRPVSEEVLAAMATTQQPDGVLLTLPLAALSPAGCDDDPAPDEGLWLCLDTVQDPGNLGTLMRTALAAGVSGLWLADGADPYQPKVLRASAGAALALRIWRGPGEALIGRLRELGRAPEVQIVASVPPAQGGLPYWELDWSRPTALLLGSEGTGLAEPLLALADRRVTVPHGAAVESLNVAVAAAPLLLERHRQQLMPAPLPQQPEASPAPRAG